MKRFITLFSVIVLTACATAGGPPYEAQPIAKGKAQVVVYRPDAGRIGQANPTAEISGVKSCKLWLNRHFIADIPAGKAILRVRQWDLGTSTFSFDAKAGQRQYIRVEMDSNVITGQVLGGFIGANLAMKPEQGPFLIRKVDMEQGRQEVARTLSTLDKDCQLP